MHDPILKPYMPTLYTCIKCRGCIVGGPEFKDVCPMNERFGFFSYSSGGVVSVARGIWEGAVEWTKDLSDLVYACTMCRACAEYCRNKAYISNEYMNVPVLVGLLRRELVSRGIVPPLVRNYLKSIQTYGNPFSRPETERADWAKNNGIEIYSGQEYLFFVGDVGSFDERGQKSARAVAKCLTKAGISFGILGQEEFSDGNEVKVMGESEEGGLFDYIAQNNIEKFKARGVKKIVTLSPHGYNAFKNEYSDFNGSFEVIHYTQLLAQLAAEKKLSPRKSSLKVTYHDPCFLGRYNGEYEAPRSLLAAIPGMELREMELARNEAFCCGGGGSNFFTDKLGKSKDSPNRIRIRQACDSGAEVIAVACPRCSKMLDDAVKDEGLEGKLKVKDIAEIIQEAT